MSEPNPFRQLWDAGYTRLVPIVPPDAMISERSSLAKRVGTARDPRGKAPGIRWPDGTWSGFDWINHTADERDLARWHAMGAGAGIKTGPQDDGTWLVGVDADTLTERFAAAVSGKIRARFGVVPMRVGRAPKALYVVRVGGPLRYSRVEFQGDHGPDPERVEILSEGKQFVAWGVHPVTREPYRWIQPLQPFDALPVQDAEALS